MDEQDVRVRRYGEVVLNTLSTVKTVLEYPKGSSSVRSYNVQFENNRLFVP